jgi:hypothetical protein
MNAQAPPPFLHFREYAAGVRPALDADFASHVGRLLGNTRPLAFEGSNAALSGGKKTRGTLLCLVNSTLGGSLERALPRATAIELIQTATLIHDDYVDQHPQRRNAPALWTLEGSRKAVLLGDVLFASAIHMMSEMGPEEGKIVASAIADVSRGAYQEPLDPVSLVEEIETGRVNGALYERIIHLKTGVLFGAACSLGATAAGADATRQQAWLRYGLRVGEAYQIADDLHEVQRHLLERAILPIEIAALAPALLFFAQEVRTPLLRAMRLAVPTVDGELLSHFQAVEHAMKVEIGRRQGAAASEVDGTLADNGCGRLARETPYGLIALFDEASSLASSP